MAHVVIHITLQNSVERAQKSHEAVAVDCRNLHLRLSDNVRGTRLALEECALSEVVRRAVVHDLGGFGAGLQRLCGNALARDQQVEVVTFLALSNDGLPCSEAVLLDGVSDLASLVVVHGLQNGDGLQEVFVLVALVLSGILHDVVEGVSVELPERNGGLGHNRRCSRRVVEQGQLSEGVAWLVSLQECCFLVLGLHAPRAIQLALLHDVEDRASLILRDDGGSRLELLLLHRIDDDVKLGLVQGLEHERHLQAHLYFVFHLLRLRHHVGLILLLFVVAAENLSTDGGALGDGAGGLGHDDWQIAHDLFSL
uniref:Uncharacterized protein n=1 Tax=Favella ehrenbergii TaxID=182087 RepID=A0A7S3HZM5_9SPIT|mmetsp:Transcript_23301/g.28882  ORF Transcript_23301/g.28882 Transcript_23301/m.28882 type:complete len:311 (+) Transcript_23301:168-1100(+)